MKLAGALAVFGALGWFGFDRGRWYVRRVNCLRQWQTALLEGERMLCDLRYTTPDYLQWLMGRTAFSVMARQCIALMKNEERLEPAWHKAVAEAQLPLQEDELRLLSDLGTTLGRYDGEEQRRVFRVHLGRLEELIVRAEEDKRRLGKMWSVLGLSCGALAVVLLY